MSKAYPQQLSGDQQQRIAIARAISNNPKLILADEPTGNLDYNTGIQVMELLKELNSEGITVIMVTHD
ncbi:ATP-binding cassette domain-containing protein [Neglectibacter sp. CSJ-5]|uniref:ATP-binding cassette domain-containing protein n=1 Tax=Neglectibacter sp. CSJ-5 TaxID=3078043 RepID=UPI002931011C|nr:ATP-binding cassette domain-containing protein [Neglectibacter sp. CSJ-5]